MNYLPSHLLLCQERMRADIDIGMVYLQSKRQFAVVEGKNITVHTNPFLSLINLWVNK